MLTRIRLVRDQAKKCFDVYLQRIHKYGGSLPDTVLPLATNSSTNGAVPRIAISQTDNTGWAGWAISSFTNKLSTANGDMQPKATNLEPLRNESSSSMPPAAGSSRPPPRASVSTLPRQAFTGTPTSSPSQTPEDLDDDKFIDEPWGDIDEDSFFDAPTVSKTLTPPITFDDGGEPDFEGWLKAQAQAKLKAPLPKGLTKQTGTVGNRRQTVIRTTASGSISSDAGIKKLPSSTSQSGTTAVKPISMKPNLPAADDDWGDAWD